MKRLLKARGYKARAGYTIVEVMIVFAVTGGLFVSAAVLLTGRQATTEAVQAVRDYESKIQSVASDVLSGYYPGGYKCTFVSGTGVKVSTITATAGTNYGCVSLGKVVAVNSSSANVITVIGQQYAGASQIDASTIAEASPIAVALDSLNRSQVDVTEQYTHLYGLEVTKIKSLNTGTSTIGAFGFITSLGGGVSTGSPVSGSRSVQLYTVNTSSLSDSLQNSADKINTRTPESFTREPDGILICMKTGNGKKASITVGDKNTNTNTFIKIDTGVGTDCD